MWKNRRWDSGAKAHRKAGEVIPLAEIRGNRINHLLRKLIHLRYSGRFRTEECAALVAFPSHTVFSFGWAAALSEAGICRTLVTANPSVQLRKPMSVN